MHARCFQSKALSCLVKSSVMIMPGVLASLAMLARMVETVHVDASFRNRGRWRVRVIFAQSNAVTNRMLSNFQIE